jgi:hypothetical protein
VSSRIHSDIASYHERYDENSRVKPIVPTTDIY